MTIWTWIFLIVAIVAGGLLYIRFTPIDAEDYAQSPKTAPSDGKPHEYRLVDDEAPQFDIPASQLSQLAQQYLSQNLGGKRIDDAQNPMLMTYEVRTKLMGYRDYISVEIEALGEKKSRLNIFSRSHFGVSDMGANKARVEKMIADLKTQASEN